MDPNVMLDDLKGQQENLRKELLETERLFNEKKEQFIRIQGAVEALSLVDGVSPPPENTAPEAPENPSEPPSETADA